MVSSPMRLLFAFGCTCPCLASATVQATCADVTCVAPYENKPNAKNIPCANHQMCSKQDLYTCCAKKGGSSSPSGSHSPSPSSYHSQPSPTPAPRPYAPPPAPAPYAPTPASYPAPPGMPCSTAAPPPPTPAPPAPTCVDFTCPTPYVNKPGRGTIRCVSPTGCTAQDRATCCDETCLGFTCPPPYINKRSPQTIKCAGPSCTAADEPTCCIMQTTTPATTATPPPANCASFTCPSPYVSKPHGHLIKCLTPYSCTAADESTCCVMATTTPCLTTILRTTTPPPASCASFTCPPPYKNKPNPRGILCITAAGCTATDLQTCCVTITTTLAPATCLSSAFTCPLPYQNKPNPGLIHCMDPRGCTAADERTCCIMMTTTPALTTTLAPATCATFTCPVPYTNKPNPGSIHCMTPMSCTAADEATCCIMTGSYAKKFEMENAKSRTPSQFRMPSFIGAFALCVFFVVPALWVWRNSSRNSCRVVHPTLHELQVTQEVSPLMDPECE